MRQVLGESGRFSSRRIQHGIWIRWGLPMARNEERFETLAAQAAPQRIGVAEASLGGAAAGRVASGQPRRTRAGRSSRARRVVFCRRFDLSAWLGPIKSLEGRPGHPLADSRILLLCGLSGRSRAWRMRDRWRALRRAHRLSVAVRRSAYERQDLGRFSYWPRGRCWKPF